jgi:hypothetical protein
LWTNLITAIYLPSPPYPHACSAVTRLVSIKVIVFVT